VTLSRGRVTEEDAVEPVEGLEAGRVLKSYLNIEKVTRPYFELRRMRPQRSSPRSPARIRSFGS